MALQYDPQRFHPVIELPKAYRVYDHTQGQDPTAIPGEYGIGRYHEKRPAMYTTPLFGGTRDIHMGIDISGPVGTPIHAFAEGEVFSFEYRAAAGDYGATLITRHRIDGQEIYVLHGHLQRRSLENKKEGQKIAKGEIIAWIGNLHENGGWPPHLHFQLSFVKPATCDMPGVVSQEQLEEALRIYPDPRWVLGPLY